MAKRYGGRWELIRDLGKGGQGDVFEARDMTAGESTPTVALKRVRNSQRHARFRNEVEAIKRLSHVNIIKLIDHSALDTESDDPEKQYLVMPLARGGDLSKRAAMYKGNLDGTLIVAQQIALALKDAHAGSVIHRDVKPENILFQEESNDVWLTDFGICFLRDQERGTAEDEVVGPWAFMAPELERGGVLEVNASADVYSLGKLIYYMISGGIIVSREEISDSRYANTFSAGGRYHMLNILLRRMICDVGGRIQSMAEVIAQLGQIAAWDQRSELVLITPKTRETLEQMQRDIVQSRDIAAQNQATHEAQLAMEAQVHAHVVTWLQNELEKVASVISDGIGISASAHEVQDRGLVATGSATYFRSLSAVELIFSDISERIGWEHVMKVHFCTPNDITVQVTVGGRAIRESIRPPADRQITILPLYVRRSPSSANVTSQVAPIQCFFGVNGKLVLPPTAIGRVNRPSQSRAIRSAGQNIEMTQILFHQFRFSEWPVAQKSLHDFLSVCCERFAEAVARQKNSGTLN